MDCADYSTDSEYLEYSKLRLCSSGWSNDCVVIGLFVCLSVCLFLSLCFALLLVNKAKVKINYGHTPKERRLGAHLPFIGRWVCRWINHYCLWRMASATPDLQLPSQPKLVLSAPTHRGMVRLSWPGWLVTYRDSLPVRRRVTHPGINRAQRRVTTLIETNALPLSQTAKPIGE